ncbi:TNFAIP3-interacting protein 1 isoform X3 [Lepisosteus oculatus]|uniref:TNFAIP3-interacting protein 1 isoform X3 n=1 Tax=Lepisosteus oculatus TaxID=7918 RepID=UPI0007404DBA|nr:PREDICTED: TNFAIP3-interacting protein 3-like isoform X3 [Lepisosteus oculatus]
MQKKMQGTDTDPMKSVSLEKTVPSSGGASLAGSQGERLLSGEEQVTLITESMSVTSADEEKLLLLNKNTELRRLNKELMKLNEEWDHIYRSTTLGLQQRVGALEQESSALKRHNGRLLLKLEHEQSKREYYEQTMLQELRKNQHLQEYVRLLEGRLHRTASDRDWGVLNGLEVCRPPEVGGLAEPPRAHYRGSSQSPPPVETAARPDRQGREQGGRSSPCRTVEGHPDRVKEVQDLKEQLEALRCQTRIYEADYKTEHKDRERMQLENSKLRRKEGEMRQQMALLQEQLKVYEDDFRKERSDKQVLQRLLLKKSPPSDPVLVHRCNNNEHERPAADRDRDLEREKERERAGAPRRAPCSRHGHKPAECPRAQRQQRHAEVQASPFSIDYH